MNPLLPRCAVLLLATVLAGCDGAFQPTLAPDVEPQLLIGQSPLQPLELDKTTTPPTLVVGLTVNRGIAEVAVEDKFTIRVTGEFKLSDGSSAGAVVPKAEDLAGLKDTGIRDGSDVAFIMDMDIPAPTWYAVQGLNEVAVQVSAQLIMTTGSGAERVLDEVVVSGLVDPGIEWEALVSDISSQTIMRISSSGVVSTFHSGLSAPRDIVVEPNGDVVVTELGGNLRRIAADGSSSTVFATGLGTAAGIALEAATGDFIVTQDVSGGSLLRVSPDGSSVNVIAAGLKSEDVEIDADGYYVLFDELSGALKRVDSNGSVSTIVGPPLGSIPALAFEANWDIVAVNEGGAVLRVAGDGSGVTTLLSGLSLLEGIAVTPQGELLISQALAGRVIIVERDGSRSTAFAEGFGRVDHLAIRRLPSS